MMIKSIMYVFLLLIPVIGKTQVDDSCKIYWSSDYKLSWDDFKGKKPSKGFENGVAATYTGFEQDICYSDISTFICYFNKRLSWTITSSEIGLIHEQVHFDIAEVYARKIRRAIGHATRIFKRKYYPCIKKIIDRYCLEYQMMQDLYELETNHSHNVEKQKEWNLKIEKMLKKLDKYKSVTLKNRVNKNKNM